MLYYPEANPTIPKTSLKTQYRTETIHADTSLSGALHPAGLQFMDAINENNGKLRIFLRKVKTISNEFIDENTGGSGNFRTRHGCKQSPRDNPLRTIETLRINSSHVS